MIEKCCTYAATKIIMVFNNCHGHIERESSCLHCGTQYKFSLFQPLIVVHNSIECTQYCLLIHFTYRNVSVGVTRRCIYKPKAHFPQRISCLNFISKSYSPTMTTAMMVLIYNDAARAHSLKQISQSVLQEGNRDADDQRLVCMQVRRPAINL